MTGLVKEELLTRPAELGVRVEDGEIVFDGMFLRPAELLAEATTWNPIAIDGEPVVTELPAGSAGLTVCQVPVVVRVGEPELVVTHADGSTTRLDGPRLDRALSEQIFARTGEVVRLDASVPASGA